MLSCFTALRRNSFIDGSNVSCMLKRNKLKGNGTTGDSTLPTLLPFYLKLFSVLLFQMYLSFPLNRVTLHLHLFLCTLWWERESNEMVIIRAKGLTFLFLNHGSVISMKYFQAYLDPWLFQEVTVLNGYFRR
jgi:hypothetical protein